MKKILLLGGSSQQIVAIETAKKMGYFTILCDYLKEKGAKSVAIAAFLDKHIAEHKIDVNYLCFDCPNEFIVGYGLDYMQYYRNLPYVSGLGE